MKSLLREENYEEIKYIFKVNGIWQLGRPDEVDKEDDEDLPLSEEHVQDNQPQLAIPHDTQMLTQIWGVIQNIQESMTTMRLDINTCLKMFDTRFERIDERMNQLKDRINQIERHQCQWLYYDYVIVIFHVEHC